MCRLPGARRNDPRLEVSPIFRGRPRQASGIGRLSRSSGRTPERICLADRNKGQGSSVGPCHRLLRLKTRGCSGLVKNCRWNGRPLTIRIQQAPAGRTPCFEPATGSELPAPTRDLLRTGRNRGRPEVRCPGCGRGAPGQALSSRAAWAAARRASGTRNGEQLT